MKLKPCPFCGEVAELEVYNVNSRCSHSTCCNNNYCVINDDYPSQQEAIEAWNHRPLEDQLKAHAVEVLAKVIYKYERSEIDSAEFESHEKWYQDQYRAEARALLGWEE